MSIYSYMYLGYVVKRQDGSNCWRHCYVLNCKWRKWSSYRRTADETAPTGISVSMRLPKAHWCILTIHSSIRTKCHDSNSVDGNYTTQQWLNCTHIVFQFSGHFFFKIKIRLINFKVYWHTYVCTIMIFFLFQWKLF